MGVSPHPTFGSAGNGLTSGSLAANTATTFNLDVSAGFEAVVQIGNTGGGTVAATNGCQVTVLGRVGSTPVADTVGYIPFTLTTVVSTLATQSFKLPWGRYTIQLKNLDVTNAITVVATYDLCDSIG